MAVAIDGVETVMVNSADGTAGAQGIRKPAGGGLQVLAFIDSRTFLSEIR